MNLTARIAVVLLALGGLVVQAHAQPLVPVLLQPGGSVARLEPAAVEQPSPVPAAEWAAADGRERWWVSADYLFAFTQSTSLPALVTTSPVGTPIGSAGVIGKPGTHVLFGGADVNGDLRTGFQLDFGAWLDTARSIGLDAGFFVLESRDALFSANSNTTPIIARPFQNALTLAPSSQLVAFPGVATGSIAGSDRSNNLYGVHIDAQEIFFADQGYRLESLIGYRFLRFDDRLMLTSNEKALGGNGIVAGTQFDVQDYFNTQNMFNGFEIGFKGEFERGPWSVQVLTKVALGDMHHEVMIAGSTTTKVPGMAAVTSPGGFLALSSNSGQFGSDRFTAIPELGAILGWNVTPNIRLRLGYSVLFLNNIARASDQVSLAINPNLFPPPVTTGNLAGLPAFNLIRSDMWVQTVNLGLEFRY